MPPSSEEPANTETAGNVVNNGNVTQASAIETNTEPERDEFGLLIKRRNIPLQAQENVPEDTPEQKAERIEREGKVAQLVKKINQKKEKAIFPDPKLGEQDEDSEDGDERFADARSSPAPSTPKAEPRLRRESSLKSEEKVVSVPQVQIDEGTPDKPTEKEVVREDKPPQEENKKDLIKQDVPVPSVQPEELTSTTEPPKVDSKGTEKPAQPNGHMRGESKASQGVSEWSHQQLAPKQEKAEKEEEEEDEWQTMPAYAPYDMYDDDNKLIAREELESDTEKDAYAGLGGAGKGYTRIQLDEDAQSATSLDENTQYLFKDVNGGTGAGEMEDEEQRDAVSQMQATKDLLTEGQRIAYVGMTRLILSIMLDEAEKVLDTKGTKKELRTAAEAMKMWSQKMMVRLYAHMDISTAEQIMIEQLSEHGVVPADLTPTLMHNARVKNPMAENPSNATGSDSPGLSSARQSVSSPRSPGTPRFREQSAEPPPPYEDHEGDDLPEVQIPSQLPTTAKLDIDLRWTVLCDLFLTLIADSIYDARSRVLLERVGQNMGIDWLEICRFEKRVTDALEMQQAAEKENWNEDEHKESRRKAALKKRYVMMGLATVGGGLVIGLSAGLLAPVIGAGLAAGFGTIGVAGTGTFLAGAGGAAIITSAAATSGGVIAVRAANRRTGAVKTFEYRPLHNNKRVNLIVTVSGWMTGKVDDVRLPYSTVDPIMGDIYSVLWEPEMLRSMGDTINILATEALTQGLQQVLASTILTGLMAALTLPVVLTKLAYLIDNPWTVSCGRADMAGLILADSLIARNLGTRPITFVGYSLGSRVIFSCLQELSRKGAYGLVQNVYLFGSPIVAKKDEYLKARAVVAGRFVNGYARNDWILGYLFRLTNGGISRVAGLAPVLEIPGIENLDVTQLVPGHMAYRTAMPKLLREAGWMVESDEFTEIEDPDPENHAQRQRELINEIEEARKEFERQEKEKESKGKFGGFFSRKKKSAIEKKEWETYEESKGTDGERPEPTSGSNDGVLFDIDAIRAELASEMIEVKELKSTLPPMKLDIASPTAASPNPRDSLRETKSYDHDLLTTNSNNFKSSTSTIPPAAKQQSWDYDYDDELEGRKVNTTSRGWEEDEIQMTFDTAYKSPPLSSANSSNHLPLRTSTDPPQAEPTDRAVNLLRPELKSSSTAPAPVGLGVGLGSDSPSYDNSKGYEGSSYGNNNAGGNGYKPMDFERNAWADDDDDEFKEKEIQMTFA